MPVADRGTKCGSHVDWMWIRPCFVHRRLVLPQTRSFVHSFPTAFSATSRVTDTPADLQRHEVVPSVHRAYEDEEKRDDDARTAKGGGRCLGMTARSRVISVRGCWSSTRAMSVPRGLMSVSIVNASDRRMRAVPART
jgi:hypothetical protein